MLWQTATISSSAKEFVIEHTPLVVHSLIAGKPVGADLSGTLPIMMINKIMGGKRRMTVGMGDFVAVDEHQGAQRSFAALRMTGWGDSG